MADNSEGQQSSIVLNQKQIQRFTLVDPGSLISDHVFVTAYYLNG